MTPTLLLLAAAAVGVDTGWQPLDSGGYEYIIQISPEQLESLRNGGEFASDLPSDTGAIRSYKIVVGRGPVLNQGVPLPPEARVALKPPVEKTPASPTPPAEGAGLKLNGADGTTPEQEVSANKIQSGSGERPQRGSTDWRGAGEKAIEKATETFEAAAGDDESVLPRPPAFSGSQRNKPIGVFGTDNDKGAATTDAGDDVPPASNDTAANRSEEKAGSEDAEEEDGANPPATVSKEPADTSLKFWNTFLTVLTIGLGSLIGWLGFLAWDFRNRYIELLHDLDTQAAPVEEPTDRYESARERDTSRERNSDEEDERDAHDSRRSSRSDMAFVGRKVQRHRDEDYDEESA